MLPTGKPVRKMRAMKRRKRGSIGATLHGRSIVRYDSPGIAAGVNSVPSDVPRRQGGGVWCGSGERSYPHQD
eukprot:6859710-Prymnesium_polylepis.1